MLNRDGDSIVVVGSSILSSILSSIPPNHHHTPHFTNNPHRLYRLDHHSNEIQGSDKKINNQLGDDIDIIDTKEEKEEKGENGHKRGYDWFTQFLEDEIKQFATSNFENEPNLKPVKTPWILKLCYLLNVKEQCNTYWVVMK